MKKYTIDFNVAIKGLDGKDLENKKLGQVVAELIITETTAKGAAVIKLYGWGITLHAGDKLELDDSDWQTLHDLIGGTERMQVLLKAPALQIMLDAKNKV